MMIITRMMMMMMMMMAAGKAVTRGRGCMTTTSTNAYRA